MNKDNKRTLVLSIAGIILLFGVLLRGFPVLLEGIGNVSSMLHKKDNNASSKKEDIEILIPPTLSNIPNATTSAYIKVDGNSEEDGTVEIYLNKELSDEIEVSSGEEFESKLLKLKDGENEIRAKMRRDGKESDFSENYSVILSNKEPSLDISFPQDGAHFVKADKRITIKGKTEDTNNVTVNGTRAIVESTGSFSYLYELNEGDNQITIIATNEAGKQTEKKVTVSYSRD